MDMNMQAPPEGTDADRRAAEIIGGLSPTQPSIRERRAALVAALSTPATTEEVCAKVGLAGKRGLPHLAHLVREVEIIRRGPQWLATRCSEGAPGPATRLPSRLQPIRDMILAFLSEPRQAMEVARHIGRPVPNATGHLAAMARLGLVVRIGYGRYARADLLADGTHPAVIVRPHPVRDAVLGCLDRPIHYGAVAALSGRTPARVALALYRSARDGHVVHVGGGVFAPARDTAEPGAAAGAAVFATSRDAEASNGEQDPCIA